MLNKRITKSIRNKVVAGVLVFVTLLSGGIGFKYQHDQINNLKYQLELKQDKDNKDKGNYISIADIQSIENEFNKLNSYTIFNGSMNLKHTYEYQRDSVLGLKSRGVLTANATVYYEYKIDLANADISVDYDRNTINIMLPKPTLNEASVHRKNNTFAKIDEESTTNILMNSRDGLLLQRYWEETFDMSAIDKLNEYYDDMNKEEYLQSIAKREVLSLINTLGINKTNININIK